MSPRTRDLSVRQQEELDRRMARMAKEVGEKAEDYHNRVFAAAKDATTDSIVANDALKARTSQLFAAIAAVVALALLFFFSALAPQLTNMVTQEKYKALGAEYASYKLKHPDVPAAPVLTCPAAGNVVLSLDEYDKLKARPETCEKPKAKAVHESKQRYKREVIITEPKENRREKIGAAKDHCIFRVHGKIMATETFPKDEGETKCPKWRDVMLERYHRNPDDLIWAKKYPNGKPE